MSGWLKYEEREEILRAIDAYEGKNSWHLPQTNGHIEWCNDKTLAECHRVLAKYRSDCLRFAAKCDRLVARLEEVQNHRRQEALDELAEQAQELDMGY